MKRILLALLVLTTFVSCGKGPAGKDGINGLNGLDGQDGTLTKVVKFCPNLVDEYGTQYSEQGLCIDGKVYAVYSSNGLAALVEVSYGTYVTTTPKGDNCTFTVNESTCK